MNKKTTETAINIWRELGKSVTFYIMKRISYLRNILLLHLILLFEKIVCRYLLLLPCSQSAFTYSKLTIETLEHGVKYVQN